MRKYLMPIVMIVFMGVSAGHGAEKDMLHIVYTQWEPYTYQENDKDSGFEVETVRAVIGKMGLGSKFEQLPWKRCLLAMENGQADVLVSALKTPEREKFLYYPDEFISLSKTVFFTKKGNSIQFDGSFDSLKNYTIGVIRGFSYGDAFDKAVYLKKDELNNTDILVKVVSVGRNDLGAENMAVITASAKKQGVLENIRFLEKPIHSQKLYVVFSKVRFLEKTGSRFSEMLKEFKKTEDYRKILEKYGMKVSDMTE